MSFDVIIIGGGAAGISAALWCGELGLNSLLLELNTELGGQLLRVYNRIENHLGARAENGREMRDIFLRQIKTRRFAVRLQAEVAEADLEKKTIRLANGEVFPAKFIVIAAGVKRRKLSVEGEEEFKNKGLIESGRRDPDLVRDKAVAVVGGGDAAFENALILAETAKEVFLLHRGKDFRARSEFVEKVLANPKIKVLTETIITKFAGDRRIEVIELKNLKTNEKKILSIQAVLIRAGVAPDTKIFRGKIDLDEKGYIKIDSSCETSVRGVFAAGDVANRIAPTVSSAVGMGATAAKAIFAQLNNEAT